MTSPRNATEESKDNKTEGLPKLQVQQQLNVDVASGLASGIFCSGLFNPWDRALYLSVKNNKPFLSAENFSKPYQGVSQALVQRSFIGGIYFVMQGELKEYLYPYLRNNLKVGETTAQFCVGTAAGSVSGVLTNPISAMKYHTWNHEHHSFLRSAKEMWSKGGVKPFTNGAGATMARDMVFGSTYEVLRNIIKNNPKLTDKNNHALESVANTTAAGVATVASGPLNYVRSVQYATPPNIKPPRITQALTSVWQEAKQNHPKPLDKLRFIQQQFRIGWGTIRVAAGMAVGQKVFDWTRDQLAKSYSNKPK